MLFDSQLHDDWTPVATLLGGICSGFFGMITACFTAYLTYLMYRLRVGQDATAVKLEKVNDSHSTWLKSVSEKQDAVLKQVDVIEKATNSMKDALVEATRSEAFQAGGQAERDKNEPRHVGKEP